MRKNILFINRMAPYATSDAPESLDALMLASTYNQKVSVLFMDDGVFQLIKQQKSKTLEMKNIAKMLASLEYFEIDAIYVDDKSLQTRNLKTDDLLFDNINIIDAKAVAQLMQQQDAILSF